jgi:cytochrome c oxidase subunit 2
MTADGVLVPRSDGAHDAASLMWVLFAIAAVVVLLVAALVIASAVRSRRRAGPDDPAGPVVDQIDDRRGVSFVVGAGIAFPVVVLTAVFLMTLGPLASATDHSGAALTVDVTAHRWWWDVQYEHQHVRIANELHIPVGRTVLVRVHTADVIHSFWAPQLGGKADAIPGTTNQLKIRATHAGVYDGKCAEYCGLQHARMRFVVVVHSATGWTDWVNRMQRPPPTPSGDALAGRQVFLGSSCVYCHAVDGTNASSHVGPDLTHLASRRRLAAGLIPNDRGHLAGWLLDPQSVKPGALMPAMDLPPRQLQQLMSYLETLD